MRTWGKFRGGSNSKEKLRNAIWDGFGMHTENKKTILMWIVEVLKVQETGVRRRRSMKTGNKLVLKKKQKKTS